MLKHRALLAFGFAASLAGAALAAPPRTGAERSLTGAGHVPQLDGTPVTVEGPNGRTFAAWAHRARGEFDIAVSYRDAATSTWAEPTFIGKLDGINQSQPALAIDGAGTLYLAFASGTPSRVSITVLPSDTTNWSVPSVISGLDTASTPTLLIVGDRLIVAYVAYRSAPGPGMANLPLFVPSAGIELVDGPDGFDPLGGIKGPPPINGPKLDYTPVYPGP